MQLVLFWVLHLVVIGPFGLSLQSKSSQNLYFIYLDNRSIVSVKVERCVPSAVVLTSFPALGLQLLMERERYLYVLITPHYLRDPHRG